MTLLLAALAALVAFGLGRFLSGRSWQRRWVRVVLVAPAACAGLPCLLFVAYYAHVVDSRLYFEWRAQPVTDLLPSLVGLTIGWFTSRTKPRSILASAIATLTLVGLAHAKPHLIPLAAPLQDTWNANVCLQSTGATCGPCSAATVLRSLGVQATEAELATESHTSATGTLNWLLVRALRARGVRATYHQPHGIEAVRFPAILGVRMGQVGHFIAYLGRDANGYLLGDPLVGPETLGPVEFARRYQFDHFAIELERADMH
jgi:hypothetical protein